MIWLEQIPKLLVGIILLFLSYMFAFHSKKMMNIMQQRLLFSKEFYDDYERTALYKFTIVFFVIIAALMGTLFIAFCILSIIRHKHP
jgi:hypothetical protein